MATFSVQAVGGGGITYQWKKDGHEIANATGTSLVLENIQAEQLGEYTVVVSGAAGNVESQPAELSFVDWSAQSGIYQGLLVHDNDGRALEPVHPGRLTLTLTRTGALSGRLEYRGLAFSFSKQWSPELTCAFKVMRYGQAELEIHLELDPFTKSLAALVVEGDSRMQSEALLSPRQLSSIGNPAPETGRYTAVLNSPASGQTREMLSGYVMVTVSASGGATVVGRLGDKSQVSSSGYMQTDGSVAVYDSLYRAVYPVAGYIAGRLQFDRDNADNAVAGPMEWSRPVQVGEIPTKTSVIRLLEAEGSVYVVPGTGQRVVGGSTGLLNLATDDIWESETSVTVSTSNRMMVQSPAGFQSTLLMDRSTGVFTGSVLDLGTRKKTILNGVVLQSQEKVLGFYLKETGVGNWTLLPVSLP